MIGLMEVAQCVACAEPCHVGLRFVALEGQPVVCERCLVQAVTGVRYAWDARVQQVMAARQARQARGPWWQQVRHWLGGVAACRW